MPRGKGRPVHKDPNEGIKTRMVEEFLETRGEASPGRLHQLIAGRFKDQTLNHSYRLLAKLCRHGSITKDINKDNKHVYTHPLQALFKTPGPLPVAPPQASASCTPPEHTGTSCAAPWKFLDSTERTITVNGLLITYRGDIKIEVL